MKKKLILIGAGGFAKSVIDSIDEKRYSIEGFIDNIKNGSHLGYKIFASNLDELEKREDYCYFIAIGDNEKRTYWYKEVVKRNLDIINVIDKTAILSENITFGRGIFIGKLAIINNDARIGENVVINTKALIEHGCRVGNNVNISTNTVLNGDVVIKDNCFIGSSSVINGQITIEKNSIVGSGTVVIKDVEKNVVVAGIPAKVIRRIENE